MSVEVERSEFKCVGTGQTEELKHEKLYNSYCDLKISVDSLSLVTQKIERLSKSIGGRDDEMPGISGDKKSDKPLIPLLSEILINTPGNLDELSSRIEKFKEEVSMLIAEIRKLLF